MSGAEIEALSSCCSVFACAFPGSAEEAAAKRREAILAEAAKDCQKLKNAAHGRMDKAAQAILERVVES